VCYRPADVQPGAGNREVGYGMWPPEFRNSDVLPFPFLLLYNDCQGLAFKENKKGI